MSGIWIPTVTKYWATKRLAQMFLLFSSAGLEKKLPDTQASAFDCLRWYLELLMTHATIRRLELNFQTDSKLFLLCARARLELWINCYLIKKGWAMGIQIPNKSCTARAWISNIGILNTLEHRSFWFSDFQCFNFGMVDHSYDLYHSKTETL